jgi:hypothetical protein
MHITVVLDHWRGVADSSSLQQALTLDGPWQFSRLKAHADDATYAWLAPQFGLPDARTFAAWMHCNSAAGGCIYELSPCHWQPGRNDIHVLAAPAPTQEDMQALVRCANDALQGAAGLHAPDAQCWYMQANFDVPACSLPHAVGHGLQALLPHSEAARPLQRVINTVQMAWYDHPVNRAREAADVLPINAFWAFGGPVQQPAAQPVFDGVLHCGHASARLAQAARLPLYEKAQGSALLAWFDHGRYAVQYGAPLPEHAYATLQELMRALPRDVHIDIVATGPDGIAKAKRRAPSNTLHRWWQGFAKSADLGHTLLA